MKRNEKTWSRIELFMFSGIITICFLARYIFFSFLLYTPEPFGYGIVKRWEKKIIKIHSR